MRIMMGTRMGHAGLTFASGELLVALSQSTHPHVPHTSHTHPTHMMNT